MLKLGIIGENTNLELFLDSMLDVVDLKVSCLFSPTLDRARELIKHHKLVAKATDLFETVVDETDAVYICTPVGLHYETAKYFLQQQKHVLIERPMALDINQAVELYQTAQKNNVVLLEVNHLLHKPIASTLFDLVQKHQPFLANLNVTKRAPNIKQICQGNFSPPFDEINGKGTTFDLLAFPVALSVFLFGKVKEVKALNSKLTNGTAVTNLVLLRHENDVLVNISCSALFQGSLFNELVGEKVIIGIEDLTKLDELLLFETNTAKILESTKTDNDLNSFVYLLQVFVKMILSSNNNLRNYLLNISCETIRILGLVEKN